MTNLIIYLTIGVIVGAIIHLLDNRKNLFNQTMIVSVLGALVFGIFSYFYLDSSQFGVSISSILLVTSTSLFLSLVWRMIYKPSEKTHTQEYSDWLRSNNSSNRYEYATYSDIRRDRDKSKRQLDKILGEIAYPASKRDVVKFAEEKNASKEALTALEQLPDHIYESPESLKSSL